MVLYYPKYYYTRFKPSPFVVKYMYVTFLYLSQDQIGGGVSKGKTNKYKAL